MQKLGHDSAYDRVGDIITVLRGAHCAVENARACGSTAPTRSSSTTCANATTRHHKHDGKPSDSYHCPLEADYIENTFKIIRIQC